MKKKMPHITKGNVLADIMSTQELAETVCSLKQENQKLHTRIKKMLIVINWYSEMLKEQHVRSGQNNMGGVLIDLMTKEELAALVIKQADLLLEIESNLKTIKEALKLAQERGNLKQM